MDNERKNADLPISDLVQDLWPQPKDESLKSSESVTEDDIELTEAEIEQALRTLKRKKAAQIRTRQYWDNVNRPIEYPKFNAQQVKKLIIGYAERNISGFTIDDENEHVINLLCLYFAKDPLFESNGFSLKKGIFLFGPVGCGKTSLMRLFRMNLTNSYSMVSCRKVADDYAKSGTDGIIQYRHSIKVNRTLHYGQDTIGTCFDDFGAEPTRKNWGNDLNVMESVLQYRYDYGLIGQTHITSNIDGPNIEEFYGLRIRSRCREMFNWIAFDKTAKDRRL